PLARFSSLLFFLLSSSCVPRALLSFPTRRSSDLVPALPDDPDEAAALRDLLAEVRGGRVDIRVPQRGDKRALLETVTRNAQQARSEEDTSELQSRENLVCRLLLEKKKKLNCHREL